jgi:starch synthase
MRNIKVLMTGYEVAPFFKRGGLGDVMGSLPKALSKIGVDCRVVIPYYAEIRKTVKAEKIGEFHICFEDKEEEIGAYETQLPNSNCKVYLLSNKPVFTYGKHGGKNKRIDQFAFFSLAVARFIHYLSECHKWTADIVHCNDWHTALIPFILTHKIKSKIPTLLTIHNLNYQGIGSLKVLDLLSMRDEEAKELKRGKPAREINILGEGIIHATYVSTVSRTYAKEVTTDYKKNSITPFLQKRVIEHPKIDGKVVGILNGIDCDTWNPANDNFIFHKYDSNNWEIGKKNNKEDLLRKFGLEDRPTFCFVGRLASQKGLDILAKIIKNLESLKINLIILGTGNITIRNSVSKLAEKYPSWIKTDFVYSEDFAHKLYAGSDFIIIPSRYEPCGLIQMIAMRYGTIPIASDTGGLRDSILNGKNGFLFKKGRSLRLKKTIIHSLNVMRDKEKYKKMVHQAMKTNFTWDKSAILYKKLYKEVINVNIKSQKSES